MREVISPVSNARGDFRIDAHIAEVSPACERRMTKLTDSIALLKQSALARAGELMAASCRCGASDSRDKGTTGASRKLGASDAASSAAIAAVVLRGDSCQAVGSVSSPLARVSKRHGLSQLPVSQSPLGLFGEALSPSESISSTASRKTLQHSMRPSSSSPVMSPLRPHGTWDVSCSDVAQAALGMHSAVLQNAIPQHVALSETRRRRAAGRELQQELRSDNSRVVMLEEQLEEQ